LTAGTATHRRFARIAFFRRSNAQLTVSPVAHIQSYLDQCAASVRRTRDKSLVRMWGSGCGRAGCVLVAIGRPMVSALGMRSISMEDRTSTTSCWRRLSSIPALRSGLDSGRWPTGRLYASRRTAPAEETLLGGRVVSGQAGSRCGRQSVVCPRKWCRQPVHRTQIEDLVPLHRLIVDTHTAISFAA